MSSLIISIAQLPSDGLDLEKNTQTAVHAIQEASKNHADLILFPELFLCGYDLQAIKHDPDRAAVSLDSPHILTLQQACKNMETAAIIGACLRVDAGLVNSAVVISKDGKIICTYHKMHLFAGEKSIFISGTRQESFQLNGFHIGVGICYDGGFPEFSRALTMTGADLLVFPSAFADGDARRRYHLYFPVRALENTVFIATANLIGSGGNLSFFGESMVIDPSGKSILDAGPAAGLFTAAIEKSLILKMRKNLTYLADRKPDYKGSKP